MFFNGSNHINFIICTRDFCELNETKRNKIHSHTKEARPSQNGSKVESLFREPTANDKGKQKQKKDGKSKNNDN